MELDLDKVTPRGMSLSDCPFAIMSDEDPGDGPIYIERLLLEPDAKVYVRNKTAPDGWRLYQQGGTVDFKNGVFSHLSSPTNTANVVYTGVFRIEGHFEAIRSDSDYAD
jgi:hypothetical protein